MQIVVILLLIALVILGIFMYIHRGQKDQLEEKREAAASTLISQHYLEDVIKMGSGNPSMPRQKLMLELSWKSDKVERYIFDPTSPIVIGRNTLNDVMIDWDTVSANHCQIYAIGNQLCLSDMNSTHGTFVKRGRKLYRVTQPIVLEEGDTILLDSLGLHVHIFVFDTAGI